MNKADKMEKVKIIQKLEYVTWNILNNILKQCYVWDQCSLSHLTYGAQKWILTKGLAETENSSSKDRIYDAGSSVRYGKRNDWIKGKIIFFL